MGFTQKIPDSDIEKVKKLHFEHNKTYSEIAELYSCGRSSVTRYMAKHGVKGIKPGGRNKIDPGKEIIGKDVSNGLTNRQIASKYGVGIDAALNWIRSHGYDVNRGVFRYSEILTKDKLKELEPLCKSDRELAEKAGVTYKTVSRLRKKYGVPNPYKAISPGYNVLFDLYIIQELNQSEIAEKLGVTIATVSSWLNQCDIRKRNRAEQIAIANSNGAWSNAPMKARHTQIKNRVMKGSAPQQAVLGYLITTLEPLHEQGWEIVIGQQNWCILDGCYEIDIPIVAMNDGVLLKIAVEVDGIYWHKGKSNIPKDIRLRDKGWIPFHFTALNKTVKRMAPDIEKFVESVYLHIASHS